MNDARKSKAYVAAKAVFWLSAGVTMAAYLGLEGVETYQIMRGGSQAPGRVVATSDYEREYNDGRSVAVVTIAEYEFLAEGVRFTGRTEGAQGSLSEGDEVMVEFNPRNPTQNRVVGDRGVLGDYFVLAMFGGAFAYYAIRWNVETLVQLRRAARDLKAGEASGSPSGRQP